MGVGITDSRSTAFLKVPEALFYNVSLGSLRNGLSIFEIMADLNLQNDNPRGSRPSPPNQDDSPSLPLVGFAERYNELFHKHPQHTDVGGRLSRVLLDFPRSTIATTSGGIQSGLLLAHIATLRGNSNEAVRALVHRLPIIFLDTGDLFPETIVYTADLQRRFGLNVRRYRHRLTEEELTVNIRALEGAGLSPQGAFDEITKVRPMRAILSRYQAKVWIAGNRRDQSRTRADLPFATVQNDTLKVFPLADVAGNSVQPLLSSLDIPAHPLAHRYRSVGNRSDTQESHGPFEKSGRHNGLKEECGLHEAWARRGRTLVRSGAGFIPVEHIPIERLDLR